MKPSERIAQLADSLRPHLKGTKLETTEAELHLCCVITYLDEAEERRHPIAKAHPAPTSSPGEDEPPLTTMPRDFDHGLAPRTGGTQEELGWAKVREKGYEAELERARAENARLVEQNRRLTEDDAAQRKLAAVLGMVNEPCSGPTWPASWEALISRVTQLTESERLVSELRAELAKVIESRGIVAENERVLALVEATRNALDHWDPHGEALSGPTRALHDALSALEQPQAEPSARERGDNMLCVCGHRVGDHGTIAGDPVFCHSMVGKRMWCACTSVNPIDEQPQAEPGREIVVGSTWRQSIPPGIHVKVLTVGPAGVCYRWSQGNTETASESDFRVWFTHVSDPPVSEVEQRCQHPTVRLQNGFVVCVSCGQVPKKSDFDPPVSKGEG